MLNYPYLGLIALILQYVPYSAFQSFGRYTGRQRIQFGFGLLEFNVSLSQ